MKCKDCGNTHPALPGFPNHVLCDYYLLHMSNIADASRCEHFKPKVTTNADHIRAMTDEELAELWWERVDCGECPVHRDCRMTGQDCKKLALDFLKSPVEVDG